MALPAVLSSAQHQAVVVSRERDALAFKCGSKVSVMALEQLLG